MAVVVSPLISLMTDQVMALQARGIRADFMASVRDDAEAVRLRVKNGALDLLYLTPERACMLTDRLMLLLSPLSCCSHIS